MHRKIFLFCGLVATGVACALALLIVRCASPEESQGRQRFIIDTTNNDQGTLVFICLDIESGELKKHNLDEEQFAYYAPIVYEEIIDAATGLAADMLSGSGNDSEDVLDNDSPEVHAIKAKVARVLTGGYATASQIPAK